ncbi:ATP-binding protein [Streptomyces sp. NPDC101150]|uniref:ATP-binding protein n=1 Tax=Streptomyces sp. NPDC101150 TaxID=3366114 RepID=UPI0037F2A838
MTATTLVPQRHQERYPARAESVPRARRRVAQVLISWGLEPIAEAAESVVAELAANAVLHTDAQHFGVSVTRIGAARVRLVVTDPDATRPHAEGPADDDEHGRGLLIVSALAACWGADRVHGGKRMWAELEMTR